jgi:hypothetical protein
LATKSSLEQIGQHSANQQSPKIRSYETGYNTDNSELLSAMELRENLSQHISTLPGNLVKEVLLNWVNTSDFSVVSLDKALTETALKKLPFQLGEVNQDTFRQAAEADTAWVDYANQELQAGLNAADSGDFYEGTLDELNQRVFARLNQ